MTKLRAAWVSGIVVLVCLGAAAAVLNAREPKPADQPPMPFTGGLILVELKAGKVVLLKNPRVARIGDIPFIVGEATWYMDGPKRDQYTGAAEWLAVSEVVRIGEYKDFPAYGEAVEKAKEP